MRFILWQQTLIIVSFAAMLLAYIFVSYKALKGPRALRSTVKRLIGLIVSGVIAWIAIGSVISIPLLHDLEGTPYWLVNNTVQRTFGFAFTEDYFNFLEAHGLDYRLIPYAIIATIPVIFLVLAELVIIADRLLVERPFSLHAHTREAGAALVGLALLVLAFPLWPQPDRNPAMQYIPIPSDAIDVEYTALNDSTNAPVTGFTIEGQTLYQLLTYYQSTLEADGWRLDPTPSFNRYAGTAIVVYVNAGRYLELSISGNSSNTYARMILWRNSQAMLDSPH